MTNDATPSGPTRGYRHYDLLLAAFVAVLLISNIASTKILVLGRFTFDGGTLLFPLGYIFGDVLTEVYGYRRSRRVIWTGFAAAAFMPLVLTIVGMLPADAGWPHQEAYMSILGQTPRIFAGSLVAYWCGEFTNSWIMSRMKVLTRGRFLFARTIASTVAGEGVDTIIFIVIAFAGVLPAGLLWTIFISNYIFKVLFEAAATPFTYLLVGWLKREEGVDHYDYGITYNPFSRK